MALARIKVGDKVVVIAGADKSDAPHQVLEVLERDVVVALPRGEHDRRELEEAARNHEFAEVEPVGRLRTVQVPERPEELHERVAPGLLRFQARDDAVEVRREPRARRRAVRRDVAKRLERERVAALQSAVDERVEKS